MSALKVSIHSETLPLLLFPENFWTLKTHFEFDKMSYSTHHKDFSLLKHPNSHPIPIISKNCQKSFQIESKAIYLYVDQKQITLVYSLRQVSTCVYRQSEASMINEVVRGSFASNLQNDLFQ